MNAHLFDRFSAPRRGLFCLAGLLLSSSSLVAADALMKNESYISNGLLANHSHDIFHRGVVIDDNVLSEMRGGFSISGMELSFGVTMKSMMDNIRYETSVRLTKSGPQIISQQLSDTASSAVEGVAKNFERQLIQVGGGTGKSVVDTTPSGINLQGLANHSGVVLNDHRGFTAMLHNITRNAITSTTVSNASGMTIENIVNVQIGVNNISDLRSARQREAIIRSIQGF